MKKGNEMGKQLGKWLRAGVALSMVVAVLTWVSGGAPVSDDRGVTHSGWGSETLHVVQDGLSQLSPIALANACGLGASSCFKCHNGKRAALPDMNPAKSPWHVHHKSVNNSCVGCHKGNPRIMKEDMAHSGMIKSPKGGAEACGSCHKGDLGKFEAPYKSVNVGSK